VLSEALLVVPEKLKRKIIKGDFVSCCRSRKEEASHGGEYTYAKAQVQGSFRFRELAAMFQLLCCSSRKHPWQKRGTRYWIKDDNSFYQGQLTY
jgi:hypothetical protein